MRWCMTMHPFPRAVYQAVVSLPGYHSVFMHSQPFGLLWTSCQHVMFPQNGKSWRDSCVSAETSGFFGGWKAAVVLEKL